MSTFIHARIALAAATLAGGGLLVSAGPAGATTGSADPGDPVLRLCTDDDMKGYCVVRWNYDSNFSNDNYHWSFSQRKWVGGGDWTNHDFEDKASSVRNDSDNWWKLYEDRDYRGYTLCLRPGGRDYDLGNNTSMEDDISSVKELGHSKPAGCDQTIG